MMNELMKDGMAFCSFSVFRGLENRICVMKVREIHL